jgi:type III restriction enzyme
MYPDFIFTEKGGKAGFSKVHVVETKGLHLDNPDTDYKKALMELCNRQAVLKDFNHVGKLMTGMKFEFNVIFTKDSWRADFNKLMK